MITLKSLNKMSQSHCPSRLHHTHRYNSGIRNTMLQAGQPWGCGSSFARKTEILTAQNPHCSGTVTDIYKLFIEGGGGTYFGREGVKLNAHS